VSLTNDYELVSRLRNDDVDAFDAFYQKYHQGLYFSILKVVWQPAAAQDVLQEVFLTLWEQRSGLDPGRSLSSWLFTIAYNKSVNHLRRTLRKELSLEGRECELHVLQEEEGPNPETRTILLQEAMSRLSPQKRRVLELCKLQGKSYEETAKEMQLSRHTVKEYLATAISSIKLYIRQHGTMLLFIYFHPLCALLLL
jgi:RNA polymerase sigma-70 factor (ECF subfamily)